MVAFAQGSLGAAAAGLGMSGPIPRLVPVFKSPLSLIDSECPPSPPPQVTLVLGAVLSATEQHTE